jgi:hypothetical protein
MECGGLTPLFQSELQSAVKPAHSKKLTVDPIA